jgi:uncharacterized surface protein with fasciclin (FAS1) repeats
MRAASFRGRRASVARLVLTSMEFATNLRSCLTIASLALTVSLPVCSASAKEHTMRVGGAAMYPTKNIVENAVKSKDHTTLVTAVKAAGLVDTLSGPGPYTVFAPTNAAFGKFPKTGPLSPTSSPIMSCRGS